MLARPGRTHAPLADGFVHQFSGNGAIDAATNGTYDPTRFAANFTDASDFLAYKFLLQVASCKLASRIHQRVHIYTIVQWLSQPQILRTNREMTSFPRGECVTSGWN
jgi:hypothetical protein